MACDAKPPWIISMSASGPGTAASPRSALVTLAMSCALAIRCAPRRPGGSLARAAPHDIELLTLDWNLPEHGESRRHFRLKVPPVAAIDERHGTILARQVVAELLDLEHALDLAARVEVDGQEQARGEEPHVTARRVAHERGGDDAEVLRAL